MSVEMLDGTTIRDFVEDEGAFNKAVDNLFCRLDVNHDGTLSYSELMTELSCLRVLERHFGIDVAVKPEELRPLYYRLFCQFDHDHSGEVDLQEFRSEIKQMLLAMAYGLGFLPVQMVLEEGSFLKQAVELESSKVVA